MAKARSLTLIFLNIGAAALLMTTPAHAGSCEAVVGKWAWFVGGEVTIKSDGTFTQQSGNSGTWECTDPARGAVTLRWRQGGFVNQLALSPDGRGLSSTDPSQPLVTAKKVGVAGTAQSARTVSPSDMHLSTQPDGVRQLPKDLPELMRAATERALQWRPDAIPVALEFTERDVPNPAMRGPEVRFSFLSPSDSTGLFLTVTVAGATTHEVRQPRDWGVEPLPPVFVDLPAAVRIAREHGTKGPVNRASLRIWSPSGAPAVFAWMVGNKTVNGASGEVIDYDVTGYIANYNEQWERAARGLRALMRSMRGGASSGSGSAFSIPDAGPSSDAPYDDGSKAREAYERNAAESRAYWGGSAEDYNRIKNGECTWSDSSRYGC
ncbi:MAG: hypothetical protein KF722_04635 [Nitrospira sp.]|nr:hypothetical protein [Nitrospira sp.]